MPDLPKRHAVTDFPMIVTVIEVVIVIEIETVIEVVKEIVTASLVMMTVGHAAGHIDQEIGAEGKGVNRETGVEMENTSLEMRAEKSPKVGIVGIKVAAEVREKKTNVDHVPDQRARARRAASGGKGPTARTQKRLPKKIKSGINLQNRRPLTAALNGGKLGTGAMNGETEPGRRGRRGATGPPDHQAPAQKETETGRVEMTIIK